MKSAEYVGTVVSAYRLVIDNMEAGDESLKRAIEDARNILKNDFARPKTKYLFYGESTQARSSKIGIDWLNPQQNGGTGIPGNTGIDWLNPKQNGGTGIPLGKLLRVRGKDMNKQGLIPAGILALSAGDSVRLHRADDSDRVSHKLSAVENGPDGGMWISIPDGYGPGDAVYLIQTKAMTK
jgi:putative protease